MGTRSETGIGQSSSSSIQLRPGDHWISLSATFDEKTKQWRSELDAENTSDGAIIQPDEHWFDLKHCGAAMNGVGNATPRG